MTTVLDPVGHTAGLDHIGEVDFERLGQTKLIVELADYSIEAGVESIAVSDHRFVDFALGSEPDSVIDQGELGERGISSFAVDCHLDSSLKSGKHSYKENGPSTLILLLFTEVLDY